MYFYVVQSDYRESTVLTNRAAAIRQASSSVISSQLTPLTCKPKLKDSSSTPNKVTVSNDNIADIPKERNRDELLYNFDEERPNGKIDKIIEQKNKEIKERQTKDEQTSTKKQNRSETVTPLKEKNKRVDSPRSSTDRDELLYISDEEQPNGKIEKIIEQKNKEIKERQTKDEQTSTKKQNQSETVTPLKEKNKRVDSPNSSTSNKKKRKDKSPVLLRKKNKVERKSMPFNQLLNNVVLVISGIQNPERANIRSMAITMGARYKPDWDDNTCTHLICAFPNTPKFNQVRGKGKIVTKNWIHDCHSQRKRFPWRRYALDRNDKGKDESEEEIWEKISEPERSRTQESDDSSVDDVEEAEKSQNSVERKALKGKYTLDEIFALDTDEEPLPQHIKSDVKELPDFFSYIIFYIDSRLDDEQRSLLAKYITAFNGVLVSDPSDAVSLAITTRQNVNDLANLCPEAELVSADWVWECHNAQALISTDQFKWK